LSEFCPWPSEPRMTPIVYDAIMVLPTLLRLNMALPCHCTTSLTTPPPSVSTQSPPCLLVWTCHGRAAVFSPWEGQGPVFLAVVMHNTHAHELRASLAKPLVLGKGSAYMSHPPRSPWTVFVALPACTGHLEPVEVD
jgi:hypothetical protein